MFIEIQEIYTMSSNAHFLLNFFWILDLKYILLIYIIIDNDKLDSRNKVSINNSCHAPKIANDKEETVQRMYLSKDIMSRQLYSFCYESLL